ncbi:MAG: DEAD/DEAH box helicase [Blastocatellia bacterium]
MIVLHAGIAQNLFLLWGEAPASPDTSRPARARRTAKAKTTPAMPCPYDAGAAGLLAAMGAVVEGLRIAVADTQPMLAWLPAAGGAPVPSSPLIAEAPEKAEIISPFAVTTLPLATVEAVELLCMCVNQTTLAPGVIVGADLAWLAQALRFAGALVAREQFLPGLRETDGAYNACWEPVFTGPDTARLTRLAQAMPAGCRALSGLDQPAAPDTPAAGLLRTFLNDVTDHLARGTMPADTPPAAPAKGRKKAAKASGEAKTFDSLHDQWMHALRAPDTRLSGTDAELRQLLEQTHAWRRPVTVASTSPFRLCFRLEEPVERETTAKSTRAATSGAWHVRYLLQAVDDPSLLVAAADAWNPKGQKGAVLKRNGFNVRAYMLSALGQAAGISAPIEKSLKTAAPAGYDLATPGAHEFLTQAAWELEQAGYGVMLPAWWTRKGTKARLGARARVKTPKLSGTSGLTLGSIVQFDYEIALGGESLTRAELEALAKLKEPLVRIRGQWVELNPAEIEAALAFWKKNPQGETTLRELTLMSMGGGKAAGGLEIDGVSADGWIGEFLAQLHGGSPFAELPVPDEFRGVLRPYQRRGYSWLAFLQRYGLGACLADDMGLGKTVQTLALIQREWHAIEDEGKRRPVLLICPTSVTGNWRREAAQFAPELPLIIHHGATRAKDKAFIKEASAQALVVSSYALLTRDRELLAQVPWAGVILDEAQNIKNAGTRQSQAARAIQADWRIALTGTPVENNVGDLWPVMDFLNPGFMGTQADFKRRFFVPIQTQGDAAATTKLKRLTAPFILRRLKTDTTVISDLPDKLEMKVFCNLTKEQASLYEAVVRDLSKSLDDSEGIRRKGQVLAAMSKLKQVCNHPAQFLGDNSAVPGRSGKLARLTEMLEEALAAGDRALIFSQFAEMGEILRKHLQESFGEEVLFLHGATPRAQRDRMVQRFQQEDGAGPRLFILSLKAGGTGLNLTAANHVFHFDRWWNPAVENQATDRAFRIGQKRNVQVHKFLCAGTLEERIDEMLERKTEIAASIVGTGEAWLTELSNDALRDLFTLRKEALAE